MQKQWAEGVKKIVLGKFPNIWKRTENAPRSKPASSSKVHYIVPKIGHTSIQPLMGNSMHSSNHTKFWQCWEQCWEQTIPNHWTQWTQWPSNCDLMAQWIINALNAYFNVLNRYCNRQFKSYQVIQVLQAGPVTMDLANIKKYLTFNGLNWSCNCWING